MRVMVTGGAGYIGSVTAASLIAAGHAVVVLDDLSTGHADAVPEGARFVEASIVDAGAVLAEGDFDGVLHFAAKSLVGESVAHPDRYWHNNVLGTVALLDAIVTHHVPRMVFSSTAAAYGEPTQSPIVETLPGRPVNPYGSSKLAIDMALRDYATTFGFGAISLRYFNVAGALVTGGQLLGERHGTETHLVPIALQVAAGQREALAVYGTDYPTPDGTCIRDYIHVLDLADAHVRALDATVAGTHEIVNLGSGTGYSVRQVVDTARAVTGTPLPTRDVERREGDPATLVASNVKARELLSWTPERDLTRMVADAWTFATR